LKHLRELFPHLRIDSTPSAVGVIVNFQLTDWNCNILTLLSPLPPPLSCDEAAETRHAPGSQD
jgi:hypothetical protein